MINRSTRWPEAVLLRETTAEAVLDAFVVMWVACYGVPANITSDRGVQFNSAMWTDWCSKYGEQHIPTTAFHPQANGMVERLHLQMKDALRARGGTAAWADHLPWVMLGIWAAPKEESGTLEGEAALGHLLVVPGQLLSTTAPPGDTQCRRRSSRRPSGPTQKQQQLRPCMEILTSTCSAAAWDCRWWTTTRALPGAGEGAQGLQAADRDQGGCHHQGPAEAPRGASTAGSGRSATQGAATCRRRD